jgi:hypothetical protein
MAWSVNFVDEFAAEVAALDREVRRELIAMAQLLEALGPQLGRPHVDTLKGSEYANMKELRFKADNGVWRVAFAFDPKRSAVILVAGNKSGTSQSRFYRQLIKTADERFAAHLRRIGM